MSDEEILEKLRKAHSYTQTSTPPHWLPLRLTLLALLAALAASPHLRLRHVGTTSRGNGNAPSPVFTLQALQHLHKAVSIQLRSCSVVGGIELVCSET